MLGAALLAPASAGAAGPAPGTLEYLQRDNQNIADAYGRQTGAAARQPGVHAGADRGAQRGLGAAARPAGGHAEPPRAHAGQRLPRLERRQPAAPRLDRPARAARARVLHEPLRRADPRQRVRAAAGRTRSRTPGQRLQAAVPGRRDHDRLGSGLRADVLVAGPGPGGARLRRAHLRRAGPGHVRDAPARERAGERAAVLQPARAAGRGRGLRLPRRARPAGRRTSSTARRTR